MCASNTEFRDRSAPALRTSPPLRSAKRRIPPSRIHQADRGVGPTWVVPVLRKQSVRSARAYVLSPVLRPGIIPRRDVREIYWLFGFQECSGDTIAARSSTIRPSKFVDHHLDHLRFTPSLYGPFNSLRNRNRNYAFTTECPWSLNLFPVKTSPFVEDVARSSSSVLIELLSNILRLRKDAIVNRDVNLLSLIVFHYCEFMVIMNLLRFIQSYIYCGEIRFNFAMRLTGPIYIKWNQNLYVPKLEFIHQRLREMSGNPVLCWSRMNFFYKHEDSLEK